MFLISLIVDAERVAYRSERAHQKLGGLEDLRARESDHEPQRRKKKVSRKLLGNGNLFVCWSILQQMGRRKSWHVI